MKYVLVSGGVISGIGKGIIASSTGLLLKTLGLSTTAIKIDPYINVDAGTMSPLEHGEVFVLDDGGEVDLDLGNYERYLNVTLTRDNNITAGKMYMHVIEQERKGAYLGRTVQVVPHLTDAVQEWIERVARVPVDDTKEEPACCIIELGGTIGDIESGPFIEALRQLRRRVTKNGKENNFLHIHVSLVPVVNREQKSKPTQQSIKEVRSVGLSPDLIVCRCETKLEKYITDKIAMYCQVEPEQVLGVHNVPVTYRVPLHLEEQGLINTLKSVLDLDSLEIGPQNQEKGKGIWEKWKDITAPNLSPQEPVKIALVGKYTALHDSYLSVTKALEHACMACSRKLELVWVDASLLEDDAKAHAPADYQKAWHGMTSANGILVPGGFGLRGNEGMIAAARYAREKKVPYLGVCLGMQLAVVEYARNVCKITQAGSEEWEKHDGENVIIFMPETDRNKMGGTMRLGIRETHFQTGSEWSKLRAFYSTSPSISATTDAKVPLILERHRHRYEVNPAYIDRLTAKGLSFVGKDEKGERMEIVELKDHPWYVGVQFHPEYLSRVLKPSRTYLGFISASAGCLDDILANF